MTVHGSSQQNASVPGPETPSPVPAPKPSLHPIFGAWRHLVHLPIALAVIIACWATFLAGDDFRSGDRVEGETLDLLHSLNGSEVVKVVVSENYGPQIASVSDRTALAAFAAAARATEQDSPNHPLYTKTWFVELYVADGRRFEFEFHTMRSPDRTVYMAFVKRDRFGTWFWGNGKSPALYQWMMERGLIEK